MCYAIETSLIKKTFFQLKHFRDLLSAPFSKKKITALEDVSLKVNKGEIFCLLGPNGAGKTTLIKILCTLMLPSEGSALVNGLDVVTRPAEVRRAIGYAISDERSFYWRLSACQNLTFFGILNNIPTLELDQRVKSVLKLVDLDRKADTPFKDFSLGMKQRLAIARSLLTNPDVLFMDEPTRSLDPASAESLRHFIKEQLVGQQGKTIFLATHNLREVEEIGHRIAIIHGGKIKACGAPMEMQPVLERLDRYVICLKSLPCSFLERLSQKMEGRISIRVLAKTGQYVETRRDTEEGRDTETGQEVEAGWNVETGQEVEVEIGLEGMSGAHSMAGVGEMDSTSGMDSMLDNMNGMPGMTGMSAGMPGMAGMAGKGRAEISDVIACIVNMGGRIESCSRKEIPLYEIYSAYTKSEQPATKE
jgi:ABC-2 type transport system ATP-binding protein